GPPPGAGGRGRAVSHPPGPGDCRVPPRAAFGLPGVSAARPPVVIAVPAPVVATLAALVDALGAPVTVVGGWAVTCRLRMARSQVRPTEDLDVLLGRSA